MDHQKKEQPNSAVPKVTETGQPIQVLHAVRPGVSAEAGRGRATVSPPKPHPQCTRREGRTRAKGSGVFAVGPPVPLTRGLQSSWGRRRPPLPLIPWRHPKVAETIPTIALTRALLWRRGGGGYQRR